MTFKTLCTFWSAYNVVVLQKVVTDPQCHQARLLKNILSTLRVSCVNVVSIFFILICVCGASPQRRKYLEGESGFHTDDKDSISRLEIKYLFGIGLYCWGIWTSKNGINKIILIPLLRLFFSMGQPVFVLLRVSISKS